MKKQERTDTGRFAAKSEHERKVRSIRATNRTWDDFGYEADKRRITRADLLEQWVKDCDLDAPACSVVPPEALELLREALTLKANAGGAIKQRIRDALALIEG
jgi:hypothetical protein